jgi:hypothetical protein
VLNRRVAVHVSFDKGVGEFDPRVSVRGKKTQRTLAVHK